MCDLINFKIQTLFAEKFQNSSQSSNVKGGDWKKKQTWIQTKLEWFIPLAMPHPSTNVCCKSAQYLLCNPANR